jgi:CIC family chloride channel protein
MNEAAEPMPKSAEQPGSLLVLALLALIVGAVAGVLGALFRLALAQADRMRDATIALAHDQHNGFLLVILA